MNNFAVRLLFTLDSAVPNRDHFVATVPLSLKSEIITIHFFLSALWSCTNMLNLNYACALSGYFMKKACTNITLNAATTIRFHRGEQVRFNEKGTNH